MKISRSRQHRVLIIGGGGIGERHLRCFLATRRCETVVAEPNPARLAFLRERYCVEGGSDAGALLASGGFNCAVIATPAPLHVPLAEAALRHSCHVLIEKPLSLDLVGVDDLARLAESSGLVAAVAYVYRSNPLLRTARDYVAARHDCSAIRLAVIQAGQPFDLLRPDYAQTYYADTARGGGVIQDAATHLADLLNWFLGPALFVSAQSAHLALPGVTVDDTVNLISRHPHARACVTLNQFQPLNELTISLHFAQCLFRIEAHHGRFGDYCRSTEAWQWTEPPPVGRDTPFTEQAHHFLDAVEGRGSPPCTLREGMDALRFQLAAINSSRADGTTQKTACTA